MQLDLYRRRARCSAKISGIYSKRAWQLRVCVWVSQWVNEQRKALGQREARDRIVTCDHAQERRQSCALLLNGRKKHVVSIYLIMIIINTLVNLQLFTDSLFR